MSDPRDGSHICQGCRTALNVDDRNCWKCGGTNIVATAVQPADKELKIYFPAGSPWANTIAPVGCMPPGSFVDPNSMAAPEPEIQMYMGYLLKWDGQAWMACKAEYVAYTYPGIISKDEALSAAKGWIYKSGKP